jgi:aminopeptidase N
MVSSICHSLRLFLCILLYNSFAQLDEPHWNFHFYYKPALALKLFIDMVGEDKFKFAFKEFVKRWQGKHPTPHDLFYTINDVLEENYNWYWQPWYFEIGYCDLGLELQEEVIYVMNVGGYPLPIELNVEYTDGTSKSITKSMSCKYYFGWHA